jgi:thiol-disulfide isomerase/thioredoxin
MIHVGWVLLVALGMGLAACGGEEETPEPTVDLLANYDALKATDDEATRQAVAGTAAAFQTLTAQQAPSISSQSTPTRAPRVTAVVLSQTPTIDPASDVLGNIVYGDAWRTAPFTTTDGQTHTIADFDGKLVVLLLMTLDCPPCQDQLATVQEVDQRFRRDNVSFDVVYVNLNLKVNESAEALGRWEQTGSFSSTDRFTWLTGTVSPELLHELLTAFAPGAVEFQQATVLVIDKEGRGHSTAREGIMSFSRFRDVLVAYAFLPAEGEPADAE